MMLLDVMQKSLVPAECPTEMALLDESRTSLNLPAHTPVNQKSPRGFPKNLVLASRTLVVAARSIPDGHVQARTPMQQLLVVQTHPRKSGCYHSRFLLLLHHSLFP